LSMTARQRAALLKWRLQVPQYAYNNQVWVNVPASGMPQPRRAE
jgi:hypothetical protein